MNNPEINPTRIKLFDCLLHTDFNSEADMQRAVNHIISILGDHWRKEQASLESPQT